MVSAEIQAIGVAEISTMVDDKEMTVSLSDTLHVPELRMHLLSVSKITDKGYEVVFDKQKATVVGTAGEIKLVAKRVDDLYYVDGKTSSERCRNAESVESPVASTEKHQLWHRRMGHLNFRDLMEAARNGAIRGIDSLKNGPNLQCEI